MAIEQRQSCMILFSGVEDYLSHRVRFVMAEKDAEHEVEWVDPDYTKKSFKDVSPYGVLPAIADRDLTLFGSRVIMEYLDERFPHPPLMRIDPVDRAKDRLMIDRIDMDWLVRMNDIENSPTRAANVARKALAKSIAMLDPIFAEIEYFMSDELSLVDCSIAPILWRLPSLKVELPPSAKSVISYGKRLFSRATFQDSLTEEEREMNEL